MMGRLSQLVQRRTGWCCLVLTILLVFSLAASISIGAVSIPLSQVWRVLLHTAFGWFDVDGIKEGTQNIILYLRVPRALLGALVGASLALSGVGMQAFTKNPLAAPYVLGISSGASTGAVLAIVWGVVLPWGSRLSIPAGAFCGALLSILAVCALARSGGQMTPIRLVLVGVAVSAMFSAVTNFIVYTAPQDAQVREATFWMLGGLGAEWKDLLLPALLLIPALMIMLILSRPLNAMMMGDQTAITLGVNIEKIRRLLIVVTALLTACCVAVSGCIGFVGLIIPHMVRSLTGADHVRVIPLSVLCGSLFLVWADAAARVVCAPAELPVGILTAMVGGPLFLWMIRARKYGFGR